MKRLVAALLLLICAGPACAAGDARQTLTVSGVERTYLVHAGTNATHPALVLIFHGGGGQGAGMARISGFDAVADRNGFVAIYPDGINRHWNDARGLAGRDADDLAFVKAIIARAIAENHVDPKRVYATGISNGGFFSYRLACDLSDQIAAIAPVAAAMPTALAATCKPARSVPIVSFSGTADPLVPYEGGTIGFRRRGQLGEVMPAQKSFTLWQQLDRCSPQTASAPAPGDHSDYPVTLTNACEGRLRLYTIAGGGHTWPGGVQYLPAPIVGPTVGSLDASAIIWDFFRSQSLS
jgi:polyhydroxybutyrate depolymerase